jgi:hypothetical protein
MTPPSQSNHITQVIWKGMGGSYAMVQYSPSCVRESRLRARAMCVLSEQQGRWELLHAMEKNAWSRGIEPKTSALVPW